LNNKTVILGYHQIYDSVVPTTKYAVSRELFKKQLLFLKDNNFNSLSLKDIFTQLKSKEGFKGKNVCLTFDDGLSSHFDLAYPLLMESGLKGSFFIIAGFVGKEGYAGWAQLRQMLDSGMEIGSHGLSHNLLNIMPDEQLKKELYLSRRILEDGLGKEISVLSVPRGQYNRRVKMAAVALGYKVICSSASSYTDRYSSPFALGRFFMQSGDSFDDFKNIIKGSLPTNIKIKSRIVFYGLLRYLLGMKLYEKLRKAVLRGEYY